MMTKEMATLLHKLHTVEVGNLAVAYDYIGDEINKLEMDGKLSFTMTVESLKNINKDYKILKKIYKGKLEINPDSVYKKYDEKSEEYFFLMCVVKLMDNMR